MVDKAIAAEIEAFSRFEELDLSVIPCEEDVDATWCLRFLRAVRDVSFATVDANGLPSVRIIDVMAVTGQALYFLAPHGKTFHAEVMRTGHVALVGTTPDYRTCRFRGRAVRPEGEDTQRALVDALFRLNPGMNQIYPGDARYICDVFRVESGEGEYFDLGQKPIFRRPFALGKAQVVAGPFQSLRYAPGVAYASRYAQSYASKRDCPFRLTRPIVCAVGFARRLVLPRPYARCKGSNNEKACCQRPNASA